MRWTTDVCGGDEPSEEPTGDTGNRTAEDSRENEKGATVHARAMQRLSHPQATGKGETLAKGVCIVKRAASELERIRRLETKATVSKAPSEDLLRVSRATDHGRTTSDDDKGEDGRSAMRVCRHHRTDGIWDLSRGGLKRKAEECFREKWESENGFAGWLMGKPKGKSYSNMVDLFMWYTDEMKE